MPKLRPNPPYLGARRGKRVPGRRVVNIVSLKKAGALACIAIGVASSAGLAEPLRLAQAIPSGTLPPRQIVLVARSAGLLPTSEPALSGATYVVRAVDLRGTPMRVIIDARYGYILSVHRIAAAEPPRPAYGAIGMRERPNNDDTDGLLPPRAVPMRPPPMPDRPLSAAPPLHPPLPKPRAAAMAPGESAKPPPQPAADPPPTAAPPAPPPAANQAARQESFPPVTPLQ
jgi:hypothetical protein